MDTDARLEAQKQWNQNPCGAVGQVDESLEYFQSVEQERYAVQDWMLDYFDFNAFRNKNVLEIGVGQGTDMLQFAKNGARSFGADITDGHIDKAKKHLSLYGFKYRIEKCDATELNYPDSFFDCVYSFGVLHHLPEIEQSLAEVSRVLKRGGSFQGALYYRYSIFHLFYKILLQGIRDRGLFRLGYRGLMATIESGADGVDIKPFVTTYSRRMLKNKLSPCFLVTDISVHQYRNDHFGYRKLGIIMSTLFPFIKSRAGWYVSFKVVKKG